MRLLLTILILMTASIGFSQDTIVPRGLKKSPYRKLQSEPYQFFKFKKFERHFNLKEIDRSLDSLDKKAKSVWNIKDSIILFSNLAKIKDYDKAYELYKEITHNRFMLDDYGIAKDLIYTFKNKDRPDLSLRVVDTCLELGFVDTLSHYWMRSIHEARQNKAVDWRWLIDNNIFEFPVDTILPRRKRNDQFYRDSIIVPLEKLDAILKDEVLYTPEKDVIIAEVFYEIGAYLENVGSNTQAYIAYSLGKIYNGNDFKSAKRIRVVKDRLIKKKYRIPSVRKFFPKYKKGRFSYEVIKQRIIQQKMDSVEREPIPTMIPVVKKDYVPKFPKLLLIMGGLLLLLIFVLVFVKTKKK